MPFLELWRMQRLNYYILPKFALKCRCQANNLINTLLCLGLGAPPYFPYSVADLAPLFSPLVQHEQHKKT